VGGDQAPGPRRRAGALIVVALLAAGGQAGAEPVFEVPLPGRARWGEDEKDVAQLAFLAEVRALGVLYADRLAQFPERALGIEITRPQLMAARPGLLVDFRALPLTLVGRADLAEPSRPLLDTRPGALLGAMLDDLYALWRPSRAAQLVAGRSRVPFSKPRQIEEVDEPFGASPFVVDRVAPDRRWGVGFHGDQGPLRYFAGAYEDLDALEPRERLEDPSRGGAAALVAHLEWAAGPPATRGVLPARRSDPWFDAIRASAGAGALARLREDGSRRLDVSLSAQVRWRALAALAEALAAHEGDLVVGGHVTLLATPSDRLVLGARGEWDPGAAGGGAWAAAGSIGWHVTPNRRNRIALVGWLRRDVDRGTPFDGLVVFLQARL
jgi:hypothetical protein